MCLVDSYLASLFEPDHEGYLSIKEVPQIKSYLQILKKKEKKNKNKKHQHARESLK